MAKKNIEKHFGVVGVLEDFNKTLTVLENYIPMFFRGVTKVYWSKFSWIKRKIVTETYFRKSRRY